MNLGVERFVPMIADPALLWQTESADRGVQRISVPFLGQQRVVEAGGEMTSDQARSIGAIDRESFGPFLPAWVLTLMPRQSQYNPNLMALILDNAPWSTPIRVHYRELRQELRYEFMKRNLEPRGLIAHSGVFKSLPLPGLHLLPCDNVRKDTFEMVVAVSQTFGTIYENDYGRAFVLNLDEILVFDISSRHLRDELTSPVLERPRTVWERLDEDDFD